MVDDERNAEWNCRYATQPSPVVDPWLRELPLAPFQRAPGRLLDLACGAGQNALWLACRGCRVLGVDGSSEAIQKAKAEAASHPCPAAFETARVAPARLPPLIAQEAWGGILVFHFLNRALLPVLPRLLCPGGLLVYKTFLDHPLRSAPRPRCPEFLLRPGELHRAFPGCVVLDYREWGDGHQAYAALLARRPR